MEGGICRRVVRKLIRGRTAVATEQPPLHAGVCSPLSTAWTAAAMNDPFFTATSTRKAPTCPPSPERCRAARRLEERAGHRVVQQGAGGYRLDRERGEARGMNTEALANA